jgi:hypothetical protein
MRTLRVFRTAQRSLSQSCFGVCLESFRARSNQRGGFGTLATSGQAGAESTLRLANLPWEKEGLIVGELYGISQHRLRKRLLLKCGLEKCWSRKSPER